MLKSIDKVFWAVIGVVLPSGIIIFMQILSSIIPPVEANTGIIVIAFLHLGIPAIYTFIVAWCKKCSLLFVALGFLLSIMTFYTVVPINKCNFFPGMEHAIYILYALTFSIVIAIIALVLSPKKYIDRFANYSYDKLERVGNKSTPFAKKACNYIKRIFTED